MPQQPSQYLSTDPTAGTKAPSTSRAEKTYLSTDPKAGTPAPVGKHTDQASLTFAEKYFVPKPDEIMSGFTNQIMPFHGIEGFKDTLAWITDPKTVLAVDIPKGIAKESWDELKTFYGLARGAWAAKDLKERASLGAEAATHLAAAVPVVGPQAMDVLKHFKDRPYYALGEALGLVAPFLIGPKLAKTKSVKPGSLVEGVPLLRSERTGGPLAKYAETFTERSLPGGGTFRSFRAKQQAALIDGYAERVAKQISGYKGTTEDMVIQVRDALNAEKKRAMDAAGVLYDEIDKEVATTTIQQPTTTLKRSRILNAQGQKQRVPVHGFKDVEVGGVQPETAGLKKIASEMLRDIKMESRLIPAQELSGKAVTILTGILNSADQVPYKAFQQARSDMLALTRALDEQIPGKMAGLAKRLSKEMDATMEDAANKVGVKDPTTGRTPLQQKVRDANTIWQRAKEDFNDSVITKVLEADPLKIPAIVRGSSPADLRLLKMRLPAEQWQSIKVSIFREMLDNAIKETAAPLAAGAEKFNVIAQHTPGQIQFPTHFQRTLGGDRLIAELRKLGERGAVLFTPQETRNIDGLAGLASTIGAKPTTTIPNLVTAGYNLGLIADTIYSLKMVSGTGLAIAGGTAGGINLLARVMTHPEGFTTIRKFVRAINQKDVRNAIYWGTRASDMAADIAGKKQQEKSDSTAAGSTPPPK